MHRLHRGMTVAYGRHYGVVWLGSFGGAAPFSPGGRHVKPALLFPLIVARRRELAADVELDLAELLAAGLELPAAFLRPTSPQLHQPDSLRPVGELRGRTVCRFVTAVTKALQQATVEARFSAGAVQNCTNREALPHRMHD